MDEKEIARLRQIDFCVDSKIHRNKLKCVLCGKCVATCKNQNVNAITKPIETLPDTAVKTACVACGQCILACPLKALYEKTNILDIIKTLDDSDIVSIALVAPSVRVALGEEFGLPIGTDVEGKLVTALKKCGFEYVYDVDCGADFTIMEEGEELLERLNGKNDFPLFSSCCPSWTKYMKNVYPALSDNLSDCKSPNEMLGSLIRYIHKGENVRLISIMPCVSKKNEIEVDDTIDLSITTRECANLIRSGGVDFCSLEDSDFDNPLGEESGGGLIFGSSGGVSESMLRYVLKLKGEDISKAEVVRNVDGVKEVEVTAGETKLSLCVVNGLGQVDAVMKSIMDKSKHYDFVEVMACEGGCICGGGQPFTPITTDKKVIMEQRRKALFNKESTIKEKVCSENKSVQNMYNDVLKNDKALIHSLLHIKR